MYILAVPTLHTSCAARHSVGGILSSETHNFWVTFQAAFNGVWKRHRPQWPDAVFMYSVDDFPNCKRPGIKCKMGE